MKSMRRFLLLALIITICLLAVLEGLWSYRQGVHEIDEVFDAQLAQYARTLLGLIDHATGPQGIVELKRRLAASDAGHSGEHHPYEAQLGFQVWHAPGELIGHSASLPRRSLVPMTPGYHRAVVDGDDWLFFCLYDSEHQRWIVAGQSSAVRRELAGRFALRDISSAIALAVALGLAVLIIMRVGLAPLDKLARQVAVRDANDLGGIDCADTPRELQALVASINSAFDRLDKALGRERQFANDAAHELRTPVSIIQTQLENALAVASGESVPALESALESTRSLTQLISQLLELARLAPESMRDAHEEVELYALVAGQIAQNLSAFDSKCLQVSLSGEDAVQVCGNRRLLEILVRNLLDNATKYTPEEGEIKVCVDGRGGKPELRISDSGPGIPPAQRQRALQRFYRLPPQQAEAGVSGCGLGLALVDMITQIHGAQLDLSDSDAGGLQVSVRFP